MRRTLLPLALALVLPLPVLAGQVTVRSGQTLSEIAEQHGVSLSRLMQLNGISDPDHVEAGMRLTIPGAGGGTGGSGATAAGTVKVRDGETLSEIAERNNISLATLMRINGIQDPDHVEVGQTLRLSGTNTGSTVAAAPRYDRSARVHVVRAGESLSGIADGYGVPLSRLVAINDLSDPDHVEAGMRLKLQGSPAASAAAAPAPRPRPQPSAGTTPTATVTPRATVSPAVARASTTPTTTNPARSTTTPAATGTRPTAGTPAAATTTATATTASRTEWRTYGPLQVDWANWQPMGGSLVTPSLNSKGQSIYLAINCSARKLNATTQEGQWRTWDDPVADFERQLVTDLCKNRS
jgi:LysM repeat protein